MATSSVQANQGLKAARLLMVLSSVSPLFLLWAIRGNSLISDWWFISGCALMFVVPNGFLLLRIRTAKRMQERRELSIGSAEDHRDHLLVYLFAMLLPFYSVNISTWREVIAALAAVAFVVFLFWHLNLHYMNLFFAIRGYRVFTLFPSTEANPVSGKDTYVLLTKRVSVEGADRITAYRLSDTVYLEQWERK
jgi:hypothetical protein